MSDDGLVEDAYSQYSDFEDLLYDAEPGADLAEDLASHAMHSPVFADEPGYELLEHHSDWEYYSDDYYDDDPEMLKQNPQDGSLAKRPASVKRGKKRKLADIADIPEIDLGERAKLKDCIRGTVWAQPAAQRDNTFTIGAGEKVALLQDWRKRFQSAAPQGSGKSKRRNVQRDESWANDMSLADMGLLNERGNRVEQTGETNGGPDGDEGEEEEDFEDDDGYDEAEDDIAEAAGVLLDDADLASLQAETEFAVNAQLDLDLLPSRPQKRPRRSKDLLPSPPTSTESTAIDGEPLREDASVAEGPKRGRSRPSKAQNLNDVVEATEDTLEERTSGSTLQQKSKKRKASASPPPSQDSARNRIPTKARGKRIASVAVKEGMESKAMPATNTPSSTRATRSKN